MKTIAPVVVAAAVLVGGVTYVVNLNGTCETDDGRVADAAPPSPPDAAPAPPDASPPPPDAAPAPPGARTVKVFLHPLESGRRWVSFGMPLPAGVLADVAMIRVRAAGAEVPAFVRSLGDWRAIPPPELLCTGYGVTFPGVRSALIQFQLDVTAGTTVDLEVDLGVAGARFAAGVPVRDTYRVFDDDGALYSGSEGFREPAVYAAIDPAWLRCAGMAPGQRATSLATSDGLAERNFFTTAIADYRTSWDAPSGSWTVDPVNGPNLSSADDGVWLYQRAQNFWNLYYRTGWVPALRAAHQAFWHYQTLVFQDADCAAVPAAAKKWCAGGFKLKNPDPASPFKDAKYTYAEDFSTYYWLTGDDSFRALFPEMRAFEKLAVDNLGWTERFAAYELSAAVADYEVTGAAPALAAARALVDDLVARQARQPAAPALARALGAQVLNQDDEDRRGWMILQGDDRKRARAGADAADRSARLAPRSLALAAESNPGCILGNVEWGPDGFSPWMSPILMSHLARYYQASGDDRVPGMLARQAGCILARGMAVSDGTGGPELRGMLVPFYGARVTGPLADVDGSFPLAGAEHAINVAQGLALGAVFEADGSRRQALLDAIPKLRNVTAAWDFSTWTRLTAGRPKYRLQPWRKDDWWFGQGGQIERALQGPEALP